SGPVPDAKAGWPPRCGDEPRLRPTPNELRLQDANHPRSHSTCCSRDAGARRRPGLRPAAAAPLLRRRGLPRRLPRLRSHRPERSAMSAPIATVADCMKVDLVTLTPDIEIVRAVALLLENRVSGACVLDAAGELVGVLSKRDCLKAALNASYYKQWRGIVADYMSPNQIGRTSRRE